MAGAFGAAPAGAGPASRPARAAATGSWGPGGGRVGGDPDAASREMAAASRSRTETKISGRALRFKNALRRRRGAGIGSVWRPSRAVPGHSARGVERGHAPPADEGDEGRGLPGLALLDVEAEGPVAHGVVVQARVR